VSLLAALLLLPLAAPQSIDVPANDGWVTDLAGLLTPAQEASLEEAMESYKQGSGHDVAVLTVPSLDGAPIERFALEVGRTWKLGREGVDDSALLVVAKAERKLRIEVGRGAEGDLTDAISGRIIRDILTPRFKQGRFYDGLREGVEAIHAAMGGDYAPLERHPARGRETGLVALFPMLFALLFFIALAASARRARRRGGVGGSALPWILLGQAMGSRGRGGFGGGGFGGGGFGGGGFSGFGGGGGFSGGGASGGW
jgi:uncharacterized protein